MKSLSRHLLVKFVLALVALLAFSNASARCIAPIITPTECTFKREDTHLAFTQPAWKFSQDDKVEELIKQGESFIHNYYATVKTTGDLAIRAQIPEAVAAMARMEIVQAAEMAVVLANDPWSLKTIYTDILCEIYFEIVEGIVEALPTTRFDHDRDCPTTNQLLIDLQQLQKLDEVRERMTQILVNPDIILGEQWTGVIENIEATREKLNSLDTFGRNINSDDVRLKYAELYPNLDVLLAAPDETMAQFNARTARLTDSKRNTILDTMKSTHQNYINLVGDHENDILGDLHELAELQYKSKRAVGQMQAMEIANMLESQKTQGVMAITEELLNSGAMFIQNYADIHGDSTRRRAYLIKSAEPVIVDGVSLEAAYGGGRVYNFEY